MMKVLHCIGSLEFNTGGPANSVPTLVVALRRAGVDADLCTSNGLTSPAAEDVRRESGKVFTASSLSERILTQYDLVHDHGIWLPHNHRLAKQATASRIPRVVSPRGMLEPWSLRHRRIKKKIAWLLYQRRDLLAASALHATADSEARQFRNLGFCQTIICLPNGLRLSPIESVERKEIRRDPSRVRTALFLSRIHPKKGLPMLIEAWARIQPAGWRMIVAGPDEQGHVAELKQLVKQFGLEEAWQFTGAAVGSSKTSLLQQADLFILPTHSENFGIVVAEALAEGVPVLTTTGAPWQQLREFDCGWWVKPSAEEIGMALRQAVSLDDKSRTEMGRRGACWVRKEFAADEIGKSMAAAYRNLLQ